MNIVLKCLIGILDNKLIMLNRAEMEGYGREANATMYQTTLLSKCPVIAQRLA